uniref:FIST C-domain domain-containing protein n=1 Tax=Plectus sambesii TaxID=2011161 RepID=A0A914WLJ3_9BILA
MEEVGALLQSGPELIKRILRALSARELHRVSRVCRTWQKYAALVLKERRFALTMTATKQNQDNSHEAIVDNPETKQFLRDLDMDCGLAIMFLAIAHPSSYPPAFVATLSSSVQIDGGMDSRAMRSYFSPSSALIGAVCSSGIIGTSVDGSCHEQQEPAVDCLSAFLMPKALPEGAQMSHFSLSLTQARQLVKSEFNREAFAQAFNWPVDQATKCIILVAAEFVSPQVDRKLLSAIRVLHDGEVALAGGIADQVFSSACVKPAYVGLVFGGENVRAASLVIGQDDRTKESVKTRLTELKTKVEAWGECRQKFGFMFACCGRGRTLFDADDIETGVFKELMPDIPLNGMFSLGEFGWEFPLPLAQSAKKSKRSNDDILSYTTTFAVVGFV